MNERNEPIFKRNSTSFFSRLVVSFEYLSQQLLTALQADAFILASNIRLFLGSLFILLGGLNWSSAKYCDGNSSDYLSCTRPAAYYFYGSFEILLIVVGVLLVLLWWVRKDTRG